MTLKEDILKKLGELKGGAQSELLKTKIENIYDLIDITSDSNLTAIPSIEAFLNRGSCVKSCLDESDERLLSRMMEELRVNKQKEVKADAICEMRKTKKTGVIVGMVVLCIIAAVAVILGVLGALEKISNAWCDIIGVVDCMFGILFFVYELYDDKIKESAINNGDAEVIKKYVVKIGKVVNSGSNSININAPIGDNNTVINGLTAEQIDSIFNARK